MSVKPELTYYAYINGDQDDSAEYQLHGSVVEAIVVQLEAVTKQPRKNERDWQTVRIAAGKIEPELRHSEHCLDETGQETQ